MLVANLLVLRAQLLIKLFLCKLWLLRFGLLFANLGLAVIVVELDVLLHHVPKVLYHAAHILGQLQVEVRLERLEINRLVLRLSIALLEGGLNVVLDAGHQLLDLDFLLILLVEQVVPLEHECHLLGGLLQEASQLVAYLVGKLVELFVFLLN